MLSHSFDRFYVVTEFQLPRVEDLKLTTIDFDSSCSYLDGNGNYIKSFIDIAKELHCTLISTKDK